MVSVSDPTVESSEPPPLTVKDVGFGAANDDVTPDPDQAENIPATWTRHWCGPPALPGTSHLMDVVVMSVHERVTQFGESSGSPYCTDTGLVLPKCVPLRITVVVPVVGIVDGVMLSTPGVSVGAVVIGDAVVGFEEVGLPVVGDKVVGASVTGDADVGVSDGAAVAGDPVVGDPVVGDRVGPAVTGDPVVGDRVGPNVVGDSVGAAVAGDPVGATVAGDPVGVAVAGDSVGVAVAGDPVAGDPVVGAIVGATVAGDPVVGATVTGDSVTGFAVGLRVVGLEVVAFTSIKSVDAKAHAMSTWEGGVAVGASDVRQRRVGTGARASAQLSILRIPSC